MSTINHAVDVRFLCSAFFAWCFICSSAFAQSGNPPKWALEENFEKNSPSPSQTDLPKNFQYVATHRAHSQEHFTKTFAPLVADHATNCDGPNPSIVPLPQFEG